MSGSVAELEIRDAVVDWFHRALPGARIVHELAVGGCRADLAVVDEERLVLIEIKSERDTLTRLKRQVRSFADAAHEVIVVAHAKWFEEFDYPAGGRGFRPKGELAGVIQTVWRYPEPEKGVFTYERPWRLRPSTLAQPHAQRLLELCFKDELVAEARLAGLPVKTRWRCPEIIAAMAYSMTGKQIAVAVCRRLRSRAASRADTPVPCSAPSPMETIR